MRVWLVALMLVGVGLFVGVAGYWVSIRRSIPITPEDQFPSKPDRTVQLGAAEAIEQASTKQVAGIAVDDFVIRESTPDPKPFLGSTGNIQAALVLFLKVADIAWDTVAVNGQTIDRATITTTFTTGGKPYTLVFPVVGRVQCLSCSEAQESQNVGDTDLEKGDDLSVRFVYVPINDPMPADGLAKWCDLIGSDSCAYAVAQGLGSQPVDFSDYLAQLYQHGQEAEIDPKIAYAETLQRQE